MRLIDADELFNAMEKREWYDNADRDDVAEDLLVCAPTVDAAPVRCGECRGWEPGKRKIHKCDLCRMFGFGPNDYCSSGKRKDGEK